MPNGYEYTSLILEEESTIEDFVGVFSNKMYDYILEHSANSKFILFYKNLTHSDLPTFGKATLTNSHDKNLLYYIKTEDMLRIEQNTGKNFQTAHQSNIGLTKELYDLVGLPQPRESDIYSINDYMNVYIVNDNMKYFTSYYTNIIFRALGKVISSRSRSWNLREQDVVLSDGDFTPIDLHVAVHGIGIKQDTDFHKIRHHLFKGDTLVLLFELPNDVYDEDEHTFVFNFGKANMFVMFEKNPVFFSLIGECNDDYARYQERTRSRVINQVTSRERTIDPSELDDEVIRRQQNAWRNMLAREMMGYTQSPREVFCPLTYITADFDKLGSLFIASHIKGVKDPNTSVDERYDINNGLLLCANADALFDKHLITINQNKEIEFSFLFDNDNRLKSQLLLMQPIFQAILNDRRMEYLAYHKMIFDVKEEERRRL